MSARDRGYPAQGGVYVLQFDRPLGNDRHSAQFYVGWTVDLDARMKHHRRGTGAAITRAAVERGIGFDVVVFIPGGDRALERQIKNQKNTPRFVERYQRRQGVGCYPPASKICGG